jgi:hypothetical protein
MWRRARSRPARGISSNAVSWSAVAARLREEAHRILDPAEAEKRGLDRARLGEELHRRRGDDAEGALAADEELLEIVAGVVLAQPAQPVPDAAVGQHDLEAQGQLAGIAVAQNRNPAGIGREIAADLAAPFGAEAQREKPVGFSRRLLQICQDAAGLDRYREIDRVDRADAVQAAECQDNVVPVLGGHAAADQAGIAALRYDRQLRFGADLYHRRHLRGRGRADDEPSGTAIETARLDEIRLHLTRVGDPAARADHRLDPFERRGDLHKHSFRS